MGLMNVRLAAPHRTSNAWGRLRPASGASWLVCTGPWGCIAVIWAEVEAGVALARTLFRWVEREG